MSHLTTMGSPEFFPFRNVLLPPGSTLRIFKPFSASFGAMACVQSDNASLDVA